MSYRDEVLRTANNTSITNALMGLAAEAGESLDILKKHMFQGHPLDTEKLIKELGDVSFYLELAFVALNTTAEEVQARNTAKLRARYPDGFSTERSINKTESKE